MYILHIIIYFKYTAGFECNNVCNVIISDTIDLQDIVVMSCHCMSLILVLLYQMICSFV